MLLTIFFSNSKARKLFSLLILLASIAVSTPAREPEAKVFSVEIIGKGKPMILIPRLSSSGEVWRATGEHYREGYQCHILTLAGFAGQPAVASNSFLETVCQAITAYIREQKLDKPVIVGHSLGGFIALKLASQEPDLV